MSPMQKMTPASTGWMESIALYSCKIGADGRIAACNQRLADALRKPQAELTGAEFAEAVAANPDVLREAVSTALSGPVNAQLFRSPLPAGDTDNPVRWHICQFEDPSTAQSLLALGWDNSTLNDLERFMMRLVSVVELTTEVVVITNARGVAEYVNPRFSVSTGYAANDVIGRSLAGIVNVPDDMETVQKALAAFHAGNSWEGILRVRRKDGEPLTVSAQVHPVLGPGKNNSHFITIARDMSRQQQLQRQIEELQRLESLGTLANGLAHRFNNILAAISGQTELLLMMPERDVGKRAERILEAARKGKEVVAQLTTFGRRNEPRSRAADLVPVVRNAVNFIKTAQPRSVRIEDALPSKSSLVMSNTGEIHQVLLNLLTNALEALGDRFDGRIDITMTEEVRQVDPLHPALPCVVIAICDNGPGVPAEIRHRIFEPFFTTRSLATSTGMGLATAHGIVTRHGGMILCEDNEGGGACFSVILPVLNPESHAEQPKAEQEPQGRILLVDEAGFALESGQRMLEALNYEVVALADLTAVREVLRDDSLQLGMMILPMKVQGVSALTLAREARRIRKDMPVLLSATMNDSIDIARARAAGISEIVRKPLPMEQFATIVEELMRP